MSNGYALVSQGELKTINTKLQIFSSNEREELKSKLKIGIQWNTEVTLNENKHIVSQIYCSALPIGYSLHRDSPYWEIFARLILEASYEATSTLHY